MITSNVYQRVFRLQYRNQCATCFTIDVDGKQYLITAKHVIEGIAKSDRVNIYYKGEWAALDVVLLGMTDGEIDIAVLRPSVQLSPTHPLQPTMANLVWGQDAYFLGFPYGLSAEVGEINRDFPMPFVKKCVVSLITQFEQGEPQVIYLDGYKNPGFSGAPVICCNPPMPTSDSNPYKVVAVIKGFRVESEPVYDEISKKTHLTYRSNTGIIISYSINHALDIIRADPDGCLLIEETCTQ
jgi:Trypsin-like peptidase domain